MKANNSTNSFKINSDREFDELLAKIKEAIKDVTVQTELSSAAICKMSEMEDEGLESRGFILNQDEEFEAAIGGKENLSKYVEDEWGCFNEEGIAIADELDAKRKKALEEIRSTEEYKKFNETKNNCIEKCEKDYRFLRDIEGVLCKNRNKWYKFKNYEKAVHALYIFWGPDYD